MLEALLPLSEFLSKKGEFYKLRKLNQKVSLIYWSLWTEKLYRQEARKHCQNISTTFNSTNQLPMPKKA